MELMEKNFYTQPINDPIKKYNGIGRLQQKKEMITQKDAS